MDKLKPQSPGSLQHLVRPSSGNLYQSIKCLAYLLSAAVAFDLALCHGTVPVSKLSESVNIANVSDNFLAFRSDRLFGVAVPLKEVCPLLALKAVSNLLHPSGKSAQAILALETGVNPRNNEPSGERKNGDRQGDVQCKLHWGYIVTMLVLAFFAGGGIRSITDAMWSNDPSSATRRMGRNDCNQDA